jgi:LysR family transcriptional activator of mexEF-oprN operon
MAYARDLDLNLLRVFVVVAETGSVTGAASRLYLTQPAVSSALRRLGEAIGAPLFARAGRGIRLTSRGERLLVSARPHLEALVHAASSSEAFSPAKSDRTLRLGLADSTDAWLLPELLRVLARDAPAMRLLVSQVQFRTLGAAFTSSRVDCAVSVADDLPAGIERKALFHGTFVCVHDPRVSRLGKTLSLAQYLARDHVVVSYNGDFRGVVEDTFGLVRRARISVPTFAGLGALLDGTGLLATVPESVARAIVIERPALRTLPLPFEGHVGGGAPVELLWRREMEDDGALRFLLEHVERIARETFASGRAKSPRGSRSPTRLGASKR